MQVHFCRTMNLKKSTYFFVALAAFWLMLSASAAAESGIEDEDDLFIDLSSYGTRIFGVPDKSTGENLRKLHRAQKVGVEGEPNPEEVGSYVEGDILVPRKPTPDGSRNGMVAESYRWRDGVIPFDIVGPFDAHAMELIERAILAYHENTCIKFVPRTRTDADFISLQSTNTGCWSSVGRIGGRQPVNLQSPGCTSKIGTIIHEMMHAVGFLHEQNREERDQYVDILMERVRKGYEVNFEKAPPGSASGFGVGYDYGSVMHYSDSAFSITGDPTIITKPRDQPIGQREGFSKLDIQKIRSMYKCNETTAASGYKPPITITQLISSGGIGEIWNMIVPTDVSQSKPKKK